MEELNKPKTKQFRDWLVTSFEKNEEQVRELLVTLGVTKYAYIFHDKDVYTADDIERLGGKNGKGETIKEGDKKDKHVHVYFHTTGKFTPSKMAKIFEENPAHVDAVKLPNKTLRYLVHTNEFAPKHPYDIREVKTNIKDFEKIVNAELTESEEGSEYSEILSIIRENGLFSLGRLLDYLSVFKPNLLKYAIEKSYAFKTYCEETQRDVEKDNLLDEIARLTMANNWLLSRLQQWESNAELPYELQRKKRQ